jgi:hypothetical protein
MDLFVAEACSIRLPEDALTRASALRAKMQRLRSHIQRDGFVLEQLSLKTKTPYVQFTLTRRLMIGAQEGGADASPPGGAVGTTASTEGSDDTTTTGAGGGGGVTSALAAAKSEPMSRPPM